MWSLPNNYAGSITSDEYVFQTINFEHLITLRKEGLNIMEAAVEYLRTGIVRLSKYVREKSLIIELNFKLISLENKNAVNEISSLNPYSISWSNVCDYMKPKDFHNLARKCSGKNTTHFAYSMNWPQRVHGSNVLDFKFNDGKEGKQFLDELIEPANRATQRLYDMLDFHSVLVSPPIADCRNLANITLFITVREFWINYFFSKEVSGIEDMKKQVKATKTVTNVFSKCSSTIFYVFNYDPKCCVAKK